jgi:hypothetical protein
MLSSRSPLRPVRQSNGWLQTLRFSVQDWFKQQIINDDPFDDEVVLAQKIYEEMRQFEQVAVPIPFQSDAGLRNF